MNLEEKLAEYMELYFTEKYNNAKIRDELTEQKKAVENFAERSCRMIDYLTYELGVSVGAGGTDRNRQSAD